MLRWGELIYTLPFALMASLAVAVSARSWNRSRAPGSLPFTLLMACVLIWLVTSGASQAVQTGAQRVLWAQLTYLGSSWIAPLWFLFTIAFTRPRHPGLRRYGPLLLAVPVIHLVLVLTNPLHSWVWSSITIVPGQPDQVIFTRTAWLYGFFLYNYLLMAASLVVMARGMRGAGYRQRQLIGLSAGMLLPWGVQVLFMLGRLGLGSLDLTPYVFAPIGLMYSWGLYQLGLFYPEPRVRDVMFDTVGEGFLAVDDQGLILDVNLAAIEALELPDVPLQRSPARRVLARWPNLLALLDGKSDWDTIEIESKPGLRGEQPARILEVTLTPWLHREPGFSVRFLAFHDVTARKQVEQELAASESRYRMLINSSPVGIGAIDLNGCFRFVSPEVYDLLGLKAGADLTGRPLTEYLIPEEHIVFRAQLARLQRGERMPPGVFSMKRGADLFWGELSTTPTFDERGKVEGLVIALRDVSMRKRMENNLRSHLEQETFINDLLQTLYHPQDVQAALEGVMERLGQFLDLGRVYLCQNSPNKEEAYLVAEWSKSGIKSRARESALLRYATIPAWKHRLETRGMLLLPRAEAHRPQMQADEAVQRAFGLLGAEKTAERDMTIPPDVAEYMRAWNVLALAVFPVYCADEQLDGFLAVDDCHNPRTWTNDEVRLLWNVTKLVTGALAQRDAERAEQQQRAMSEALQDTASALNSTLHLEEVFDRILSNMRRVVPHNAASVAMIEDDSVRFVRWRGFSSEGENWLLSNRSSLASMATYQVMAQTGEAVIIRDTWTDPRWLQLAANQWIRSYLGMPILIQGQVVGFLNLDSSEVDFFDEQMAERLRVFADQAALAIQNARLYQDAQRRVEEMSTLYDIGLTITAGLEMKQVLKNIFEQCRRVLPIDVFLVSLYDEPTQMITPGLLYHDGEFVEQVPRSAVTNPGMAGAVIQARRTIYIGDTLQPEQVNGYNILRVGGQPARSFVGVPMLMLDKVLGVVSMQNFTPYAYSSEQIRLFETITNQASIAVQNAHLYDQMRQMAITDLVTGLFTRRHFTLLAQAELERSLRYKRALGVLMVDIDWFKRVNDTYGHSVGDQVLGGVAKLCADALRGTDMVGRWGGEEFAILLPEADADGAALIAERVRATVEETGIPLSDGTCIRVTVSLGVAALNPQIQTLGALVDCADQALYQAKQTGRNRVCVHCGE